MYLTKAAVLLSILGAVTNALEAVYVPEEDLISDELLLNVAEARGININALLDKVIFSAREALVMAKEDVVNLPNLYEDFQYKIWPFVVHGHLQCSEGTLRSLASIKRTGDATIRYEKGGFVVKAQLGLEELTVDYMYDASILHIGATGNLSANVTENSIILEVGIILSSGGCKLKMEEVKVVQLEEITVNISGLEPFDGFASAMAEKATDKILLSIRKSLDKILKERLQHVIDKTLCHLPGLRKV